jgi:hypothetical protein
MLVEAVLSGAATSVAGAEDRVGCDEPGEVRRQDAAGGIGDDSRRALIAQLPQAHIPRQAQAPSERPVR